jgi:hypothetical protein
MPKGRYRSRGIGRISGHRLESKVTRKIVRDKDGNIVRVDIVPNNPREARKVSPQVLTELGL